MRSLMGSLVFWRGGGGGGGEEQSEWDDAPAFYPYVVQRVEVV